MKNNFFRHLISALTTATLTLSYLAMFPISEVFAEIDKSQNEFLYASVLNEYAENIIPNGVNVENATEYSDAWYYSTNVLSDYGYQFYDLDKDGTDELFVLDLTNPYKAKVNEIYTIYNGSPKKIATGGTRWDYYVVNAENVLAMNGSSGATVNNNVFYHLIGGKLVAFEVYTNDAGTWYYASGDNCDKLGYDSMQVISESEVYSQHPETMGGIEMLIFEDNYLFSDYTVNSSDISVHEL